MMKQNVDGDVLTILHNAHIPAFSASIHQDGKSTSFAVGVTNTSDPQSVDKSTLFQAASLSKPVSAAILLDLVQQNSWDLNTPLSHIGEYGPVELQSDSNYHKLTINMVLGQCSGLPNWFDGGPKRFQSTPGENFTYSGVAFDFLKEVIEKKLGKPWEDLAQDFFSKAKMENSTFLPLEASHLCSTKTVANGHHGEDETPYLVTSVDSPVVPAGSLLTTAEDYMKFLQYCYADEFLKSRLFTTHSLLSNEKYPPMPEREAGEITWGLGIAIYKNHEKEIAFHWGTNPGSYAFCAIDLKTGDAVTSLVNSENGSNVFQIMAEKVLGNMTPIFEWTAKYGTLKAKVEAGSSEALHKQLSSYMDSSQSIYESPSTSLCRPGGFFSRSDFKAELFSKAPHRT